MSAHLVRTIADQVIQTLGPAWEDPIKSLAQLAFKAGQIDGVEQLKKMMSDPAATFNTDIPKELL